MVEFLAPADRPDGPHEWAGYLAALRAQVRRDHRGTSIPLLILGAGAAAAVAPAMVMPTSLWDGPPGMWIEVLESFYGISNRLPPTSGGHQWAHQASYLALALATVLAGVLARIRENRVS